MELSRDRLLEQGQWRELKKLEGLDFCSNDYLGLSKNPRLRESLVEFVKKDIPLSSSASRLIPGHHHAHLEAEAFLAAYFSSESGLIFNSGYSANAGVLSTLGRGRAIFSDELNHASIIDGIRLSRSDCRIFRHNDLDHLEELLREAKGPKLIVTESLFSMDGDVAPLSEMALLAEKYDALFVVDEAHASGVFGPRGEGLIAQLGLDRERIVSVHTFGKAFGSFGAFVACEKNARDLLVNFCRDLIYTTALPPHAVWQMTEAARLVKETPSLRETLSANVKYFRDRASSLDLRGENQIVPLILGGNERVLAASERLLKNGFQVAAVRHPTVPRGQERLRICIHADHTLQDLDRLSALLSEAL